MENPPGPQSSSPGQGRPATFSPSKGGRGGWETGRASVHTSCIFLKTPPFSFPPSLDRVKEDPVVQCPQDLFFFFSFFSLRLHSGCGQRERLGIWKGGGEGGANLFRRLLLKSLLFLFFPPSKAAPEEKEETKRCWERRAERENKEFGPWGHFRVLQVGLVVRMIKGR